jgi:hypothetical protein
MILAEVFPMLPLVGKENSRAFAQGTHMIQRGHYCRSYELGPVRNAFKGILNRFRDLEGNHILFFRTHGGTPR